MASSDYLLSIMAVFNDMATGELKRFSQAVIGAGKSADKTGQQAAGLGDKLAFMGGKLVAVRQGAEVLQDTMRRGFEFAELGAISLQTKSSFDGLLQSVGAAPDLLARLRTASRGTISDMNLMASTSTLLAGAQGELASRLANATPKLMEIAKAASALNPTLGDTTFLYQSLATGIKRASPLILDNLGLTIKIGEANERYAETLGKSVDKLTAEEQKIALLNETVRAGNVLITQAGDNVNSLPDDYARMRVVLDETKTSLAEMAAISLAPLMESLSDLFTISQRERDALARAEEYAARANVSEREYAELVRQQIIREGVAAGETEEAMRRRTYITEDYNLAVLGWTSQQLAAERELIGEIIQNNRVRGLSTEKLEQRYERLTTQIEDHAAATIELGWAQTEQGQLEAAYHEEIQRTFQMTVGGAEAVARAYGDIEASAQDAAGAHAELARRMDELRTSMRGAVGEELRNYRETREDIRHEMGELESAMREEETTLARMGGPRGYGGLNQTLEVQQSRLEDLKAEYESQPTEERARQIEVEIQALRESTAALEDQIGERDAWNAAYAEHSQKLDEMRGNWDEVTGALNDAKEAHREAMNQIIFDLVLGQIEQAKLGEQGTQLAAQLAENLGLIDEPTARAVRQMSAIVGQFAETQNISRATAAIELYADELAGVEQKTRQWDPSILAVTRGVYGYTMEAQGKIEDVYTDASESIQAQSDLVSEKIEGVSGELKDLTEPDYEIRLDIKDKPAVLEAVGTMKNLVDGIAGTHNVIFNLVQRGDWPVRPAPEGPAYTPLPNYQAGGVVAQTGVAFVHAGELIIPRQQAQTAAAAGPGTIVGETVNNFNLTVHTTRELTSITQEYDLLQAMTG